MSTRPPVTKTTHTLPFERLSPLEFERMCLWLVRREGYGRAEHLGAAGGEQGRDVVAWRDGRRVVFQCKRVARLDPGGAEKEIAKLRSLPAEDQPDDAVFVVSTAVSVTTRDRARAAWGDRGSCDFWAGSELDERVKRYADILHEFFDLGPKGLKALEPAVTAAEPQRYYSTYISYSRTDADRAFAFQLYKRLKAKGVSCWLYDHDMNPGEVELDTADRAIREAEKLLLCCSETSLTSWWVNDELGKAIEKERALWSEGRGLVLIPLKLDGYLLRWESGKASQVRERYPADFVGWRDDPAKFDEQLQSVLRALKVDGGREAPPAPRL
ncbi:MAG: TIR domain-containing protein [bacterium]|nr:TIR domain-containing protein [bacterium]